MEVTLLQDSWQLYWRLEEEILASGRSEFSSTIRISLNWWSLVVYRPAQLSEPLLTLVEFPYEVYDIVRGTAVV